MTDSQTIPEITLQEKQKQLEALQIEVNKIFTEAISKKVKNLDFAIEIWVNAVQEKAAYVAIASLMIRHSTNFQGDEMLQFLRFLTNGTLKKDASIAQWAVDLINQGLVINNALNFKAKRGKVS
ncbi:hypothetical protein [Microcoleus sp. BROC3]|uniref:hypothetical protein n=1 Tax=Microcoleus sp. BROC3 TaxID=3055323 RepID=UPI002FD690DD